MQQLDSGRFPKVEGSRLRVINRNLLARLFVHFIESRPCNAWISMITKAEVFLSRNRLCCACNTGYAEKSALFPYL